VTNTFRERRLGFGARVTAFVGLFVFVSLVTSKRSGHPEPSGEAEAVGWVRAVVSAQAAYASLCGGYAPTPEVLERPSCTPQVAVSSPLLSPGIVAVRETSAYRFELVPSEDSISHYAYVAVPKRVVRGRTRAFCADGSGRIYVDTRGNRPSVRGGQCRDHSNPLSWRLEDVAPGESTA